MNVSNLALRFLLELAALAGFAIWAWNFASGWWRIALALLVIVVAMALWGIFAVPNDPSRSGNAPIPIPGLMRLVLELGILLGGVYAWHLSGFSSIAYILGALVVVHHILSVDRIKWLLRQ